MSADLYTRLTATILAQLETADPATWSPPWQGAHPLPVNARTGHRYRGLNTLMLWVIAQGRGYADPRWATYRQWAALDAQVRRGEMASSVLFYRDLSARAGEVGGSQAAFIEKASPRFVARTAHVFNATQVENAPAVLVPGTASVATSPDPVLTALVRATGAVIETGGARAAYIPATDTIRLPPRAVFRSGAAYAATLTHELVHWTGALHRLARDLTGRFGSQAYAAEELVAEIGAAFVLADLGLARAPHPDHAAYCANWLPLLRTEPWALVTAASHAARAAAYLGAFSSEASMGVSDRQVAA